MQIPKLDFTTENTTLWNILNIAWRLFSENFRNIIIIVLIVYIPVDIIIFAINNVPEMKLTESIKLIGWIETLIGIIATLAIAIFLTKKISWEEVWLHTALQEAMKSWGKVVWANIVTGFMIGLLTLLFIIPWIIFWVYWTFVTFAVLYYGFSWTQARSHSKTLVTGRWWGTFGILFVIVFLPNIALLFMSFLYYMLIGSIGIDTLTIGIFGNFGIEMVNSILIDIVYSYFTVCSFVLFVAYESVYAPKVNIPDEDSTPIEVSKVTK